MPMIVTANSPLSCSTASDTANTPSNNANNTGTFMYSGTHARLNARASPYPPAQPTTLAKPIPTTSSIIACSAVKFVCHADTTENASTAANAPIGSFTIASHCSNAAGLRDNRAVRNSGAITVGPVTIMMPPKTVALSHDSPTPYRSANVDVSQPNGAPINTNRRTPFTASCSE